MTDLRKKYIEAGREAETRNVAVFGKECASKWSKVDAEKKAAMQIQYQKEVAEYERKWEAYQKSDEYKAYHNGLLTKIDEALAKNAVRAANNEKGVAEPKQKVPKDPNAPAAPLIAFFAFGADYRQRKWTDMEAEHKAKYEAMGQEAPKFIRNVRFFIFLMCVM